MGRDIRFVDSCSIEENICVLKLIIYRLHSLFEGMANSFKTAKLNLEGFGKIDRKEWVNICYQGNYFADRPYELIIKWLVATGSILGEQVRQKMNQLLTTAD